MALGDRFLAETRVDRAIPKFAAQSCSSPGPKPFNGVKLGDFVLIYPFDTPDCVLYLEVMFEQLNISRRDNVVVARIVHLFVIWALRDGRVGI